MAYALMLQPECHCDPVSQLNVEVNVSQDGEFLASFLLKGSIPDLRLPALTECARSDELWQHTCFEIFVAPPATDEYVEFNFSPSRQWAAYHFEGYRQGMRPVNEIAPPHLEVSHDRKELRLQVQFNLHGLAGFDTLDTWRLGLSAVIETTDGAMSYWALTHPSGPGAGHPDFHHSDCFALELGAKRPS